ncbi:tail assembly chaperone [Lactococcus muris]|uniref:Tail assembly chaperone n=1 Tax=Lactococcus muris TaxID=2941330 RepID=A0ABV4DB08_9LACT
MELTINGKQVNFRFGVKFVRELDKTFVIEQNGVSFGMALAVKIIPELEMANIATLAHVLFLGNRTETPKLSQGDIDDFIDECEDIEKLFDDVLKEITESNTGKLIKAKMK